MAREKFWYRKEVGNQCKWEKLGKLQLDYLVDNGLKKYHFVLDIGCGPLRAGGHFIRYLDRRHYFGIDNNRDLIKAGRGVEVPLLGLQDKRPRLRCVENFDLSWLHKGIKFDYVIAQSVFTHLNPLQIDLCLKNVKERLQPQGRFYATFNPCGIGEAKEGPMHPRRDELDWTYYPIEMFEELAHMHDLNCKYIGDWGHDLNKKNEQMMLCFTR
ncbi:MAG: class I SAM-dependent methyltransferase [Planctomycetota bacterium]